MVTRCKFRGRRGILCDVLKIDGSLARNIDFDVANFQVLRKTRRKTSILQLQSVKIGGSLARNARFWCSHLSRLASLVFPWLRRVYGGSCKTCPFVMLPIVKIAGSLVRNDRLGAPTCLVSSLVRRVYGGSRKTSPFRRFPRKLSCRFAWQAWHFMTFQPV